jgi:hypothetical protein
MVQEESMKENTAAVHVQVPVEVTSFLLNEKRTEITKIELKQRVTVLLVPNKALETPNYRLERLRHDDPRLENLQASYTMVDEQEEEVGITRREKGKPKQEPVIKGILPETPAPKPVERPQPQPVAPCRCAGCRGGTTDARTCSAGARTGRRRRLLRLGQGPLFRRAPARLRRLPWPCRPRPREPRSRCAASGAIAVIAATVIAANGVTVAAAAAAAGAVAAAASAVSATAVPKPAARPAGAAGATNVRPRRRAPRATPGPASGASRAKPVNRESRAKRASLETAASPENRVKREARAASAAAHAAKRALKAAKVPPSTGHAKVATPCAPSRARMAATGSVATRRGATAAVATAAAPKVDVATRAAAAATIAVRALPMPSARARLSPC